MTHVYHIESDQKSTSVSLRQWQTMSFTIFRFKYLKTAYQRKERNIDGVMERKRNYHNILRGSSHLLLDVRFTIVCTCCPTFDRSIIWYWVNNSRQDFKMNIGTNHTFHSIRVLYGYFLWMCVLRKIMSDKLWQGMDSVFWCAVKSNTLFYSTSYTKQTKTTHVHMWRVLQSVKVTFIHTHTHTHTQFICDTHTLST